MCLHKTRRRLHFNFSMRNPSCALMATSPRPCPPPAPAEPVAPGGSVDLSGHYLTVNSSHQQHQAHRAHDFTRVHDWHHEIQHHSYDWKKRKPYQTPRFGAQPGSHVLLLLLCFVIPANTSGTHRTTDTTRVSDWILTLQVMDHRMMSHCWQQKDGGTH